MTYRLLALDLDGTLLDHTMIVKPEVLAAVAAAREQGVVVTIATGRTFRATLPHMEALGIEGPMICYQGGAVFDSHTHAMLTEPVTLDGAIAAEGVKMTLELGLYCLVYADEKIYVADDTRPELAFYRSFHPEGIDLVVAPDLEAVTTELRPFKVQYVAEPHVVMETLPVYEKAFGGRLEVLRPHDHYLELTPLEVSKGRALAALAQNLGIPREQVVAIGDHLNDISMITWAGLGLAMANGAPEAHAAADAVIPPVTENGVAWAIEKYILR